MKDDGFNSKNNTQRKSEKLFKKKKNGKYIEMEIATVLLCW